jgi:BirA family biotin operon repressor/biotin-[acetyl-CoA-carboxylase] ligase
MGAGHHEDLHLEGVQAELGTRRFGRSLEIRELTGSTNDDARAAANEGAADGHVVVADAQDKGRGAHGRSWLSPPGKDLYLSIVAKLDVPLAELALLTLAVGAGVADAVELLAPRVTAQIKWPNDVWIDGHKIAGILVESASLGERALPVIIGIGLNVNRETFPGDLDGSSPRGTERFDTPATSLRLAGGAVLARPKALAVLLQRVEHWVDRFAGGERGALIEVVNQRLALRGQRARCDELSGVVEGVASSGALQLRVDGQLRELYAGTLRPLAP